MKFDRILPPTIAMYDSSYTLEIKKVLNSCLEKNRRVHILVEPERKGRTTGDYSQSHHLNGHIQQISKATGQPFEDVKRFVKQRAITFGYPIKTIAGNPVTDLWGQVVGISEADASTKDCALLIECTHQLAQELDITLEEGHERFSY